MLNISDNNAAWLQDQYLVTLTYHKGHGWEASMWIESGGRVIHKRTIGTAIHPFVDEAITELRKAAREAGKGETNG